MQTTITALENTINNYTPLLLNLDEEKSSYKPHENKWSKKELIGHLIDSAQNNIRRFLVAQYEDKPQIVYAQEHWVAAAGYNDAPLKELIDLWVLIHRQMVRVLKNIPVEMQSREVLTEQLHSIQWLAGDYNKHLLHHLHQVLDMEEVDYP
ncbi:MAG TPA: DinB family protein [Ferruginibacter sp.]|nr:DinB family protein [Ferruginibacter sp.]